MLPRGKREDVQRLYAWCRWCDDGVDHAPSRAEAMRFLRRAGADLRLVRSGQVPQHAETLWFGEVVRRYDLPLAAAQALLRGMRSDSAGAHDFDEAALMRYCFRVAGAVGVLMCPILGLRDRSFLPHAAALGIGMQLTNIARDVGEDWGRGRCYLPKEWTGGLCPGSSAEPDPEAVRAGVRRVLDRADAYYAAAASGINVLPRETRIAVRAASLVYHAIGSRIRKSGYRVLGCRAFVPTSRKLALVARAALFANEADNGSTSPAARHQALARSRSLLLEHGVEV